MVLALMAASNEEVSPRPAAGWEDGQLPSPEDCAPVKSRADRYRYFMETLHKRVKNTASILLSFCAARRMMV
jgi:hypothetical protein